ncbi:hypothetical protein CDAR_274851 [Caerostris darwini]|uniref:Uncharacterized protein n=1 Tax=Caerostris darwini TaxID=1538125 RepID=A0AAV4PLM6_9ARAC|nr:hypothetical protein CDAR_274851 [Caerostris darwini]
MRNFAESETIGFRYLRVITSSNPRNDAGGRQLCLAFDVVAIWSAELKAPAFLDVPVNQVLLHCGHCRKMYGRKALRLSENEWVFVMHGIGLEYQQTKPMKRKICLK